MIELVAFLGNHGKEYARNRHNVGWMLAEHLTFYHRLNWKRKFKGQYSDMDFRSGETRIHFIMPLTYMNLSGTSVGEVAAFYKVTPEQILIVHDELELPLGTASLKFSGGLGGHNGLRSMKGSLKTADFWRLRIGIGRPTHPDIAAWVLSDFSEDELPILQQVLKSAAAALELGLDQGPEKLLPDWNKKKLYFGDSV